MACGECDVNIVRIIIRGNQQTLRMLNSCLKQQRTLDEKEVGETTKSIAQPTGGTPTV